MVPLTTETNPDISMEFMFQRERFDQICRISSQILASTIIPRVRVYSLYANLRTEPSNYSITLKRALNHRARMKDRRGTFALV